MIILDVITCGQSPQEYDGPEWSPMESFIAMRTRPIGSTTMIKPNLNRPSLFPRISGLTIIIIFGCIYSFFLLLFFIYAIFQYDTPLDYDARYQVDSETEGEETESLYESIVNSRLGDEFLRQRGNDSGTAFWTEM